MVKHISCDCKCEFSSTTCNSKEKWNTEICPCESKNYCMCKNDYSWNPSTCICENGKYLKSIVDDYKVARHEIIHVMDIVSTNVTITVSINSDDKKDIKWVVIFCTEFY